jgi:hypothetical protein
LLTDLNQRFPHKESNMSARRRWDYEAHYNKDYQPPNCEKIDKEGMCPFDGGNKKLKCHQYFIAKFPNTQTSTLYGPTDWMKWVVRLIANPTLLRTVLANKK